MRLEQRECRLLWVGHHREAADVGDVLRRDVHKAAELFDPIDRSIDVINADVSSPLGGAFIFLAFSGMSISPPTGASPAIHMV